MNEVDPQSVSGTACVRIKRPKDLREALAQCLSPGSIQLSRSVCHVDQTFGFKCVLTTTDGYTFECSRVIMAVSSPDGHINFNPVLREPGQWMQDHEPPGFCIKTVLIYDQPWWRKKGISGYSQSMEGPIWQTHDTSNDEDGVYALTCIVAGESGRELWKKNQLERREAMLAHLRHVFSMFTAIPDPILRIEPKGTSRNRWAPDIAGLEEFLYAGGQEANGRVQVAGFEADDLLKARLEVALSSGSKAAVEALTAMVPKEESILAKL